MEESKESDIICSIYESLFCCNPVSDILACIAIAINMETLCSK